MTKKTKNELTMTDIKTYNRLLSVVSVNIGKARYYIHKSQARLAEECGISQTQISNYECGRVLPSFCNAYKIADSLGVTLDWLCTEGAERNDI